jgi:putative SOS response-associated peptidase YedK
MCGRYQLGNAGPHVISELVGFDVFEEHGPSLPPRWNIAPTQLAPVVRAAGGGREVASLRWGLTPSWAKDLAFGAKCVNARSETAAAKPAFRSALRARRCLVPATGFYEWTKGPPKRAFLFRREDRAGFALAGLWESWTDRGTGEVVDTFAILTTAANPLVLPVHERMPVVVPRARWAAWLDPGLRDGLAACALLAGADGAELVAREVDPAVGRASFQEEPAELGGV